MPAVRGNGIAEKLAQPHQVTWLCRVPVEAIDLACRHLGNVRIEREQQQPFEEAEKRVDGEAHQSEEDEGGELKLKLIGHDLEEFRETVKIYGNSGHLFPGSELI